MTTDIKLTDTQRLVLEHAAEQPEGRLAWFPDSVKGGARQKVLDGLFNRALITREGNDCFVAAEGYDALGLPRPTPVSLADPEIEAAVTAAEATWQADAPKPRTRENELCEVSRGEAERVRSTRQNSKQAQVIGMLQRPEGATIAQVCEATGWQAHTVRGIFAGAFKKKLGLAITSSKEAGAERVYRVA